MPVEKENCQCCGETYNVCPSCGKRRVTPRDDMYTPSPNLVTYRHLGTFSRPAFGTTVGMATVRTALGRIRDSHDVVDYGVEADSIEYEHVCWNCGWSESVTVTIERESENI